jgi:type I restriction-modification system DNA methylase subunit
MMPALTQQLSLLLEKHRNHYLFSDYYLDHLLSQRLDWQEATSEARGVMKRLQAIYAGFTPTQNEAQTERDWIRPALEVLNHVFEVQPSVATPDGVRRPDYVFFPTDKARKAAKPLQGQEDYPATALAVGDAKHWDRSLDQTLKGDGRKPRDPFTNKNPSWQIYFYVLHTGQAWGILTNGRAWRLYHKDTAHKLNYYYEVDLPALLGNGDVEAFKYFYLFFRQASFIPNGEGRTWLDIILQESRDYAQGVGGDLKDQVYEALHHVAQGFLDYPGNDLSPDSATLKAIYDNSLILLYRLLFVLYAESRALLPVQENETYRLSYSLDAIKKEIEGALSKPILPTSRLYWTRLDELFGAINKGNEHLGVPAYNGDLFAPQKHPFLKRYAVGDQELRRAIDNLARTDTEEGRVFVDYRDLEVRHLGSIYEGLLEYQLRHAEEDLAVVKEKGRERYVPAGEGQEVAVPAGRVYLVTDRGERKATGSYYTPDYIVKYIVEQTLGPLLDETFARWADRKGVTEEDLVDDILSLDVLDPAMGSGHFLVEATEYIARYLVGLGLEATAGMGAEAELDYWKRQVVQSCIYGVDLNPLAVELAKLSLWLATVSKDKPLSFLDHHLRCGNSLIGARVADLGAAPVVKKKRRKAEEEPIEQLSLFDDSAFVGQMRTATRFMQDIEAMASDTVEGVKEQERAYQSVVRDVTRQYRHLADLWTARYFGVEYDAAMWPGLVAYATGRAPAQVPQYEAMLEQAGTIAEDKRFFHWELEFPEVFFDRFGRPLKEEAGFDAVVGNPPYVSFGLGRTAKLSSFEEQFYRANFERSAEYKISIYAVFMEQGLAKCRAGGYESLIVPDSFLNGMYFSKIREYLLRESTLRHVVVFDHDFWESGDVGFPTIFVTQRLAKDQSPGKGDPHFLYARATEPKDLFSGHMEYTKQSQNAQLKNPRMRFQLLSGASKELVRKMGEAGSPLSTLLSMHHGIRSKIGRSEILAKVRLGPSWKKAIVSSAEIHRHLICPERHFVHVDPDLLFSGGWDPDHIEQDKILIRRTGDSLICVVDVDGFYHTNALIYGVPTAQAERWSLFTLSSILNSRIMNFYYQRTTLKTGRTLPQVEIDTLKHLPIRRIAFTTSPEERARLMGEGKGLEAEAVNELVTNKRMGDEGFVYSFVEFVDSSLGRWLDARLPSPPPTAPPLPGRERGLGGEGEQSDVVHDLLAHLAEQMIALNAEKQAEMRGFLDWLADYTRLPVEDWTLKTSLKAYYEQKWAEMRRVLDRNSRRIKKVNVKGREASDLIRDEWGASVEKLRPLLARIAATDRLIDLIVYRLYGLTEEEVAVVEGKSY